MSSIAWMLRWKAVILHSLSLRMLRRYAETRLTDWRVIIAFWGVAVTDPELAGVQDGHVSRARARVEKLLRKDRGLGEDSPPELARLAQQILALMLGIALQAVFEPAASASLPQRALLTDGLARLAAGRAAAI